MGALGGLDAGNARNGKNIALGMATLLDHVQCLRLHVHQGTGGSRALSNSLGGHIHHVGAALIVQMGKHADSYSSVSVSLAGSLKLSSRRSPAAI